MGKRTVIPFGPQHPVLPEPVHLDLVIEDEKVVEAIPSIGFIHRGLEKLVEKKEFTEMVYVIERICGICSFGHGWGCVHSIEGALGLEIPERADFLRTMWHELGRIHSHLLWLGLLADGFGFESLFNHCWRVREHILDLFEETTGGRVIFSVCKVGGVRKDIDKDTLKKIADTLEDLKVEIKQLTDVFLEDTSVKNRLCGVGVLTKEDAEELCENHRRAHEDGSRLGCQHICFFYKKSKRRSCKGNKSGRCGNVDAIFKGAQIWKAGGTCAIHNECLCSKRRCERICVEGSQR